MEHSKPILEFKHIVKEFPGVRALDDVSMDFYEARWSPHGGERRGQVHADENFKRCLYAGWRDIVLDGRPLPKQYSTLEARGFGVAIIYQELSLMSEMNVMENVYVSHETQEGGKPH